MAYLGQGPFQEFSNPPTKDNFTGDGSTTAFTLTFSPLPVIASDFRIFINGSEADTALYDSTPYNSSSGVITFDAAPANGAVILVQQTTFPENFGNYQFIGIDDIINNFIISYVGEDKIIPKARRSDIAFHAQRALAEMSFDVFKSIKAHEITVGATLSTPIPRDYVNYVKMSWSDTSGIEHVIYPISKTSNPTKFNGTAEVSGDSTTMSNYKSASPSENQNIDYDYDDEINGLNQGERYGIDPQYTNINGSFFIDELKGNIHFSSNLSGSTVILKYISDSLGTDDEMQVQMTDLL